MSDELKSLLDEFKESIAKFPEKFEFVSLNTNDYLQKGFQGILKIKKSLILTQKEFDYKSAKAKIEGDKLYIQGYLEDIEWLLQMIK